MRRRSARPVPSVPAGSWRAAGNRFRSFRRVEGPPIGAFTNRQSTVIGNNGINQTVVAAGGGARVAVGPQGWGTRWYPQQFAIATQTGPNDTSTCLIYLGAVVPNNLVATSYSGGGDQQGLAVPEMQPGDLLFAVWSGGHAGDWAQLTVIGEMDVLTT